MYQSPQVPVEDYGFFMLRFTAGCLSALESLIQHFHSVDLFWGLADKL